MICTFGDVTDIVWWRELDLPNRTILGQDGRVIADAPDVIVSGLSPAQANDPAVVLERVRLLRSAGRQSEAFPLLSALPAAPSHADGQNTLWSERRNYFLDALQQGNARAAYAAMNGHGFPSGERKVDAEFFAGWVALTKLNDPARAASQEDDK